MTLDASRLAQFLARGLAVLAVGLMVIALVAPLRHPQWMQLGLAALIAAAIMTIIRFMVIRTPLKGRGGSTLRFEASPLGWLLGYLSILAVLGFLEWIVLHNV
jgi:hypothetical protein